MSKVTGIIPETICIIYNITTEDIKLVDGSVMHVYPAYVSNFDNKKSIENGKSWAKNRYYGGKKVGRVEQAVKKNTPINNLSIIDLVVRSEGGRAYKVLIPDGWFYVDLREDVLLEALMSKGATPQGNNAILNGDFVFATVGSQMKLVRVGSPLYNDLVKSTELKESGKLSELIPGHIYKSRNNDHKLYLGEFYCLNYSMNLELARRNTYSFYNRYGIVRYTISEPEIVKVKLFYTVSSYIFDHPDKQRQLIKEQLENFKYHGYHFLKTHSLVEDVGLFSSADEVGALVERLKTLKIENPMVKFNDSDPRKSTFKALQDRDYQFTAWGRGKDDIIVPDWLKEKIK